MSRLHGKNSRLLVNTASVTGEINSMNIAASRTFSDVTPAGVEDDYAIPGRRSGTLTIGGFLDSLAGLRPIALAADNADNSLLLTATVDAFTVGSPAVFCEADLESFMSDVTINDAVPVAVNTRPDGGIDLGVLLQGLVAITADGDGTSVDGVDATANGAAFSLHVTAFTGLSSASILVEDSPDDSVWSTVATFASVTAVTQELVVVTGAVDQYLRASWDVTGSGSITFAVAAARR